LNFGRKIFVTCPGGLKFETPLALMDTYIVRKFQRSSSSRFGVIRKNVKTWTHLPEKPRSKNKGTRSVRAMSQWRQNTEKMFKISNKASVLSIAKLKF